MESQRSISGILACRARSDSTDIWLNEIFESALKNEKSVDDICLIAVGGYGRRELAPHSDLDVLLVHRSVKNISDIASRMWYPVWDAGIKLGHSVRTPKETIQMCTTDLDTATSLVTARVVAGNLKLGESVIADALTSWKKNGRDWLRVLHQRIIERYAQHGELAFLLEPNVKESMGGLRDIHALSWAIQAGLVMSEDDDIALKQANEVLLNTRVALHHHTNRANEILRLEDQAAVAELAGYKSDDELMSQLAEVGRRVAWISDEAWAQLDPPTNRSSAPQPIAPGIEMIDGEVHIAPEVDIANDPTLLLRVGTVAARLNARIHRSTLDRLGDESPQWPDPWPAGASDDLVALLLTGESAIPVLESFDQRNLLVRFLPEWAPVRSKPQRNAFHRYTVDRHLWQTVANATALLNRVTRPDLLVLSALFHDIGKGYEGDHTDAGVALFATIGMRMGLSESDQEIVSTLIEHHLLLADTATRRDLSDDATITTVARLVKTGSVLDLLHALTEADSLATGPSAWSDWKSELISLLVERVHHVLGGGDVQEVMWRLFPDAQVLELMAARKFAVRTQPDRVTVVSPDTPGTFSKVAGVLALHNLDVLGAEAHSDEQGMAASEFRVVSPYGEIDWAPIAESLERALSGRLALDSRIAERAANSRPRKAMSAVAPAPPQVRFDDLASSNATFLEVKAPDQVGVLHRITKVIADLGLDIRHARVLTLGNEVVDAFYVRQNDGEKITDESYKVEITRAILFALREK